MFNKLILNLVAFTSLSFAAPLIPTDLVDKNLESYTNEQREKINMDLENITKAHFHNKQAQEKPIYLATIGGPGSAKSTILDQKLLENSVYVLSDPDQGALVFMVNTYLIEKSLSQLAHPKGQAKFLEELYTKWRGASNYISNTILNKAFEGKYNIAHGTTSVAMPVKNYEKLKEAGYTINLILCASTDESRYESIKYRETYQALVQSTSVDATDKIDAIYKRLTDYFKHADRLEIYWTQHFKNGSKLAAVYENKNLVVKNAEAYEKFLNHYAERAKKMNLISFEDVLKSASE